MKSISPIEVLLALALAAVVGVHLWIDPDPSQRNWVYAPEMQEGPAYRDQDPTPGFSAAGLPALPPEGSIARGRKPYHAGDLMLDGTTLWRLLPKEQQEAWDSYAPDWPFEAWEGEEKEVARAKAEAAVLARGAKVFETFCIVCHGGAGDGDGIVTKRGTPPPKSFKDADMRALTDGHMFRSVTFGREKMPSYASQIGREDRWRVIRYIRSLQQTP